MFYLKDEFEVDGCIDIDPRREEIAVITQEDLKFHPIHGLYTIKDSEMYITVALETTDNQVDFNRLVI